MPLKQGEIWWAQLPDPLGWRPVLILTRDDTLSKLHYATVAPLTRTIRGIDSEVILDTSDGTPQRCAVTLDNIATIEQDVLVQHITTLSAERMNEVWQAMHYAFDLPF